MSVTGTGKIDLVRGRYDLRGLPKTTRPGILSVAPEVRVKGPLEDPTFQAAKRTLATSFGSSLLENAFNAGRVVLGPLGFRSKSKSLGEDACRTKSRRPAA